VIREVDIGADMAAARDTQPLTRLLNSSLTSAQARELQGTLVLAFPELERPDTAIVTDLRVRHFIRAAYDTIPHLLYFLNPAPSLGALMELAASSHPDETDLSSSDGLQIPVTPEITDTIIERLTDAAVYAVEQADDWHVVVDGFLQTLPEPMADATLERIRGRLGD
jgi:hypothetical protein